MRSPKEQLIDALVSVTALEKDAVQKLVNAPPNPALGDYSFACFQLAKERRMAPALLGLDIGKKLSRHVLIEKISVDGPYLNFFLRKSEIARQLVQAFDPLAPSSFGRSKPAVVRVVIEYSSPNTNKPLHLGHLKNNALGMAMAQTLSAAGFEVHKTQIINDRGIHICKSMLAYRLFGEGATPESTKTKPDVFVGQWYVRFFQEVERDPGLDEKLKQMLRDWEAGDEKTRQIWQKMNDWALEGHARTYDRFGSVFDKNYFESAIYQKAGPLLEKGKQLGVFETDEKGALVARLKAHGLEDKVVLRADGTSIYVTQDMVLAMERYSDFAFDASLYVVGSEQVYYFQQLFKILELLGLEWARRCEHVSHGLVFLPEGKLKSREGKVVDADDFLDEMQSLAAAEIEKRWPDLDLEERNQRAEVLSLAAIKFHFLKSEASKDQHFDPAKSLSFEGETGPYILYAFARAKSILQKAGWSADALSNIPLDAFSHPLEGALWLRISELESTIVESAQKRSPHLLCHYLLKLAESFNSFYHECPVLSDDNSQSVQQARLCLVFLSSLALQNGLACLNITVLEKM